MRHRKGSRKCEPLSVLIDASRMLTGCASTICASADILNSADDFSPSLLCLEAQYRSFLYETEPQGATEQASRSDTDDLGFGRWRSCVYSRAKLDSSTGDPGKQRAVSLPSLLLIARRVPSNPGSMCRTSAGNSCTTMQLPRTSSCSRERLIDLLDGFISSSLQLSPKDNTSSIPSTGLERVVGRFYSNGASDKTVSAAPICPSTKTDSSD